MMSIQVTIELENQSGVRALVQAVDLYKRQLEASIRRTKEHLQRFEQQYNVSTTYFLSDMTAEDLTGGDWEYVEWAGEAQLLQGLENELKELEYARRQLP